MARRSVVISLTVVVIGAGATALVASRYWSRLVDMTKPGRVRVAEARGRTEAPLRDASRALGIAYPPAEMFIRAFKHERELEVWVRGTQARPFERLRTYAIAGMSGGLGPKRRSGDLQVPEGFYLVREFLPQSRLHLSLKLDYPNASDRILSDRERPGADICIHGGTESIGCLAMTDAVIDEIYVLALDTTQGRPGRIAVHVFPARLDEPGMTWLSARFGEKPELVAFWRTLAPAFTAFEATHVPPAVHADAAGAYVIE